jgi:hypothetical protein
VKEEKVTANEKLISLHIASQSAVAITKITELLKVIERLVRTVF